MSRPPFTSPTLLRQLLQRGQKIPLAFKGYPSRGQSAVQELYLTSAGKLFLKQVSQRNHEECQINAASGTLAEREYWAYALGKKIGLFLPPMALLDKKTTVQQWFDYVDARLYATTSGVMTLHRDNIYECSLFDWVIGQVDRHDANYLYDLHKQRIVLVDQAFSFLKWSGSLPDYLRIFEISNKKDLTLNRETKIGRKLKGLRVAAVRKLVPLRDPVESNALLERLEQVQSVTNIQGILGLYRSGR